MASRRSTAARATNPPFARRATGKVSPTQAYAHHRKTKPSPARTRNTPRQSVTRSSWPPTAGDTIGATPKTAIRIEKARAAATPS